MQRIGTGCLVSLALLVAAFVTYAITGWLTPFLWWVAVSLVITAVALFARRR